MNPGSTVLGCGPREFTVSYLRLFVTGLQRRRPDFDIRPGHVGFLVSNVAWDAFFSEYFCFPCHCPFYQRLDFYLYSRGSTIGPSLRRTSWTVSSQHKAMIGPSLADVPSIRNQTELRSLAMTLLGRSLDCRDTSAQCRL
jgi:hypothetical protein